MGSDSRTARSTPPGSPGGSPPLAPGEILLDQGQIEAIVSRLAEEISTRHAGHDLTLLAVLDGALIFAADLIRRLPLRTRLETVRARSYRGVDLRPGRLDLSLPDSELAGHHLLVVDDILDTGRTLAALRQRLLACRPASLDICVLLEKPARRQDRVEAAWVGHRIPDRFVVGYGLDHDGWYRNLPHVAVLEPVGGRTDDD